VRNFLQTNTLACLLLVASAALTNAAESLEFTTHHQVVFGGHRQSVSFTLRNATAAAVTETLHHRLFQLSHRLYAPVGDGVKWREITLPAKATRSLKLAIEIPAVKARTRFKLALFAGNESRLGVIEITALPDNLLDPLQSLAKRERVGLWDPADQLRPALEKLEIHPVKLVTRWNAEDFAGDLVIAVHAKSDRDRLEEKNATFAALKRRGRSVLCLLKDYRADLPLPLIATGDARDGTLVFAPLAEVAALESAAAQLRLSQLLEFARSRAPLTLLNQYEE